MKKGDSIGGDEWKQIKKTKFFQEETLKGGLSGSKINKQKRRASHLKGEVTHGLIEDGMGSRNTVHVQSGMEGWPSRNHH